MRPTPFTPDLTPEQSGRIRDLIRSACGINMAPGKDGLLKSRLTGRLRHLALGDFAEYLEFLERDTSGCERERLIDAVTTNQTSFFREPPHFEFLGRELAHWSLRRPLRIWSAGCSTGQEPYSIAMLIRDVLPESSQRFVRILATDVSGSVLARARQAVYTDAELQGVPHHALRHFVPVAGGVARAFRVADDVRRLVKTASLNLIGPWPMRGSFDFVFCRNVLMYFDEPTRQNIIRRFWEITAEGGFLLIGHTEGIAPERYGYGYVRPSVYVRRAGAITPEWVAT